MSIVVPELAEAEISDPPDVVPTLAVPLEKVGVIRVEFPLVMVAALGVSEVATGAATTVTVVLVDAIAPAALVTVR